METQAKLTHSDRRIMTDLQKQIKKFSPKDDNDLAQFIASCLGAVSGLPDTRMKLATVKMINGLKGLNPKDEDYQQNACDLIEKYQSIN